MDPRDREICALEQQIRAMKTEHTINVRSLQEQVRNWKARAKFLEKKYFNLLERQR